MRRAHPDVRGGPVWWGCAEGWSYMFGQLALLPGAGVAGAVPSAGAVVDEPESDCVVVAELDELSL